MTRIIDLTLPLYNNMPVFPGDPEVKIEKVHHLDKEGWNMSTIFLPTHIATHVNVPIHMTKDGKTLDDYSLDAFMGEAVLYKKGMSFNKNTGVIFDSENISRKITDQLLKTPAKFVALPSKFEFDIELERILLEHDQLSFENLIHTEKLPSHFMFFGVPLNIQFGDGSPVRAFAVIDEK